MGTPSPILDLFLRVSTDHGIGTDPATRAEELLAACDFSTRDRIIVGAISAFLDGGVADTPVEEIARRAGVGKGSVFYTFGSRDRLVEVVLMTLVDVVSARVAEVRAAARGWEALEAVVRSSVELVVHNPRIAHTVFAELTRPDRKWRAALDHARGQLFRPVEEILDEVAAGGAAAGDGGGAGGRRDGVRGRPSPRRSSGVWSSSGWTSPSGRATLPTRPGTPPTQPPPRTGPSTACARTS
ncbi:TetR/AcrR family transcriptional regulator [Corynebacterium bovis]|uniref:TetR/AcrR family transcriptional regulator n=1 Tax=Corynebacterium bovis TaxID=36808 RepID=UPI0018E16D00|nr:TetR/AcrR family transcriptional regulator [Corynebacterium bovis]QQC47180.1 TetR/AcrR family transcriptional regulator [Corynebacterium bovis]